MCAQIKYIYSEIYIYIQKKLYYTLLILEAIQKIRSHRKSTSTINLLNVIEQYTSHAKSYKNPTVRSNSWCEPIENPSIQLGI